MGETLFCKLLKMTEIAGILRNIFVPPVDILICCN